jgi:hypothetical protein
VVHQLAAAHRRARRAVTPVSRTTRLTMTSTHDPRREIWKRRFIVDDAVLALPLSTLFCTRTNES